LTFLPQCFPVFQNSKVTSCSPQTSPYRISGPYTQ